jgi:CarD family transcriptional regulator
MDTEENIYKVGDWLIYPKHGLGKAVDFETQTILKKKIEFLVVFFEQERMTLRIPTNKLNQLGLRSISDKNEMKKAITALKGKARIKKTMWAKREKDYKDKLIKGDPVSVAEVLRDLYRGEGDPDQSYSERQLYETALDRFAREMVVVYDMGIEEAIKNTEEYLKVSE